eukprot:9474443-Pyramimonas_sp.AAC.1
MCQATATVTTAMASAWPVLSCQWLFSTRGPGCAEQIDALRHGRQVGSVQLGSTFVTDVVISGGLLIAGFGFVAAARDQGLT